VNSRFFRLICRLLIVSLLAFHLPMRSASAAMIGTESAFDQTVTMQNREKVEAFMNRDDVREQFQKMGLSADNAKSRVTSMTDQEINKIAGKIDEMPAGGSTVGTILIIGLIAFIVLVITDMLGWTKIFPWTFGPRE
jgi:hypothetical protein